MAEEMRILVTGGTGLVGMALQKVLKFCISLDDVFTQINYILY